MRNRLREVREECGLSQEKLCEMSGLSRPTISKIENDETANVNTSTILKICNALNVLPEKIFLL